MAITDVTVHPKNGGFVVIFTRPVRQQHMRSRSTPQPLQG